MSPLVSLTALIVVAQFSSGGLKEALRSVEEGADITFAPDVGADAAQAIGSRGASMTPDELGRHLQVALRGKAHRALAPHLGRLLAADGPTLAPALRAAGELAPEERRSMLATLRAGATRPSISLAWSDQDEGVARGAIVVLVAAGPVAATQDLLRTLLRDELSARADWALQVAGGLRPSPQLFAALLEVEPELPPALHASFAATLSTLVDQQPQLAAPVVERLRARPSTALLGVMAAMPPDQWEGAIGEVMHVVTELCVELPRLQQDEVALLAAAIGAAADLRAAELLPLLPELCPATVPLPVRLAALRALGEVGAREAGIIDLLLRYLPEPDPVGPAAFASLRLRAGARLPLRLLLWQDWRKRTPLMAMSPEEHAERLAVDRRSRYQARTSALRVE